MVTKTTRFLFLFSLRNFQIETKLVLNKFNIKKRISRQRLVFIDDRSNKKALL